MLYLRWSRQLPFSSYWIPTRATFSLPPCLVLSTRHLSSSSSSDELRLFSSSWKISAPCWSAVPRSNLGDRRGGGDCLTTPTTCPGEEEHVLQLREAAATQRTRLVHTYGRDRLPLFPVARCWECGASGIQVPRAQRRWAHSKPRVIPRFSNLRSVSTILSSLQTLAPARCFVYYFSCFNFSLPRLERWRSRGNWKNFYLVGSLDSRRVKKYVYNDNSDIFYSSSVSEEQDSSYLR